MNKKDLAIIAPLAFLTLLFGVYPKPLMDIINTSMTTIIEIIQKAI